MQKFIFIVIVSVLVVGGAAVAQMGPGVMGGQHGQGQQQSPSMGPGMMGPGGQMGPGMMGPGSMMRGGTMGGAATTDRPWITVILDHREELGLSAEQIGRLFTLRDGFAKAARAKSEAIEKAEQALDQLFGPGPVDLKTVETKLREIEALRVDLRLARVKTIEEGKAVLTPEQRQKFLELVKQSRESSTGSSPDGSIVTGRGMEEMQRFMQSERAPAAMAAMMEMARRMGDGDVMLGMVRMMEMMGGMGGMMGPGEEQ